MENPKILNIWKIADGRTKRINIGALGLKDSTDEARFKLLRLTDYYHVVMWTMFTAKDSSECMSPHFRCLIHFCSMYTCTLSAKKDASHNIH